MISPSEVKKIHIAVSLLGFAATCGSGLIMMWEFQRLAFESLDSIKLILLATALPVPLFIFNCFMALAFVKKEDENAGLKNYMIGTSFTTLSIAASCLYCHLTDSSFGMFISVVAASSAVFTFVAFKKYQNDGD